MRNILTIFACLGLAGCVAPPMLTYVSMALDGASFFTTGKSVGDHAISAAVDEDCAMLRVVTEQDVEAVCREYASQEEREAAVAPTVVTAFKTLFTTIEPGKVPPPVDAGPAPILPVAYLTGIGIGDAPRGIGDALRGIGDAPPETIENRRAIYLLFGNFDSIDGAEKMAARVTGVSTVVAPAMAGDALYFRVVAGPIAAGETDAAQSRLTTIGIDNSWAASLCTRDLGAPPCDND